MQDEEVRRGIGLRIRECRRAMRLSQAEVAARLKRTPQTVSKWELGKSMPTAEDWYVLGRIFGASLDYMVYNIRTIPVSEYKVMASIFAAPGVEPAGQAFGDATTAD